jgi:hypothetical protein
LADDKSARNAAWLATAAIVVNEWGMTGIGPDGGEIHRGGRSADVVRGERDESWLVLDKP